MCNFTDFMVLDFWLIHFAFDEHGFCVLYPETQRYEQDAVAADYGTDIQEYEDLFVQYVADNADHDSARFDGNVIPCDTFFSLRNLL